MLEARVRKAHRTLGLYLVAFLALQALSGLLIAWGNLAAGPDAGAWLGISRTVHWGWNPVGNVYRLFLGAATLAQGIGGLIIYLMIRARTAKAPGETKRP